MSAGIGDANAMDASAKAQAHQLNGGQNVLATQRQAAIAEMEAWQVTTPEGLIAFFSERLLETNRDLRSLIQGQQSRNDTVKDLTEMQRILAKVKDGQKLEPGSADWNEFQRLLKEVRGSLPQGDVADQVGATLDAAQQRVPYDELWADQVKAKAAGDSWGTRYTLEIVPAPGPVKWRLKADQGPMQGIGSDTAKDLATKLKNVADNIQGANQMDSVRVQELVSRVGQIMSTASNIVHKFDEARMAAVNNIR